MTVAMPDTSLRLAFMGVNSQRTTIQLGTAVYNACENLKQEMIRTAAQLRAGVRTNGRLWRVMSAAPSAAFRSVKLSVCLDRTRRSKAWGPTERRRYK